MSGVVGAACCCEEDHPCVGSPNCSAVAIVVEGTISYGVGATAEEGFRQVTLCDNECPPNTNPNDTFGDPSGLRQWDRSFAEVFRVQFKVLLAEPGFGNTGGYSNLFTSGTYPPIISATVRTTAQSNFETEFSGTSCPPFTCKDIHSHRIENKTFDASGGGQLDQEEITGLSLTVSRSTKFVDCDNVQPCLGELLIPGCYEIYNVTATASVIGEGTFLKTFESTFQEFVYNNGNWECKTFDIGEPPVNTVSDGPVSYIVRAATYAKIDEYQSCPPQIPLSPNATELLAPGSGGSYGSPCNPNPDCPEICCGLQEGGNTLYSYPNLGSVLFTPGTESGGKGPWVAILSNCDQVGSGNGNSASKSNSIYAKINCGGEDSCVFSGDVDDPQPAPTTIKDKTHVGNIESNLVFRVDISRKEPLYAMPDPALWPNGV